ncbi:putative membrane protein [Pedobacter sp. UYEF25]
MKDRDIQVILGTLLRVGVIISMAVVLIGGVLFLIAESGTTVSYKVFTPEIATLSKPTEIIKMLPTLNGKAIIQFGILLLIFTPISRVVFSIFTFFLEKDYMYVTIGFIVLCIIMVSLNGGFAG